MGGGSRTFEGKVPSAEQALGIMWPYLWAVHREVVWFSVRSVAQG